MATKTPVHNPNAPDFRSMFNWGLKLTNFRELFLIAGHGAHGPDGTIHHPDDAVAQTAYILEDLDRYLKSSDYTRDDIIRIEFTLTKKVDPKQYNDIFAHFGRFFADVKVKPAAGTLRVVEALALPGMVVEYEFWAAR